MFLPEPDFKLLVKNGVLFAIDLIIMRFNTVLVGQRINEPAKGFFFVPGGRVLKNETLNDATCRVVKEETNLNIKDFNTIKFKGLYEHFYDSNFFSDKSFGTHYIVCAIELSLTGDISGLSLESDHSNMKFIDLEKIQREKKVHKYTKAYFLPKDRHLFEINE